MRQIVLDTETTGLRFEDGHRVIEIGCVEMINRKFTGNHYHQYINPEREVDPGALAVHGISNEFLRDKPIFASVFAEFLEFIKDAELIIHNASFDVGFLNNELKIVRAPIQKLSDCSKITDTLLMAREMHVGQRNSLDALCKRYEIDNSHRDFHGALLDSHLLARVYLAMTGGQGSLFEDLVEQEIETQQAVKVITQERRVTRVIKASSEEIAEHQKYLQEKKLPLWEEA